MLNIAGATPGDEITIINATGQVTGGSNTTGDTAEHAFLYSAGVMTDLGTLGGTFSRGNAINDTGQVTGASYTTGDAATHAFLYSDGSMYDLNSITSDLLLDGLKN